MSITYYAPKLPLEVDSDSNFIKIDDALVNARQKLKMILLTNPGEKIYDPEFGVGLYRFLFEPSKGIVMVSQGDEKIFSVDSFEVSLLNKIQAQTIKYSPDIKIDNINLEIDDNKIKLYVNYNYKEYINDTLSVTTGI